jgi:hypothetical protein
MIIKVKEKQKYLKVYDIDMNLIGSFYTIKEAAKYINVEEKTLWSAKKRGSLLFGNYYIKTEGPVFIEHTKEWSEIDGYVVDKYRAKECALIAVDEILENFNKISKDLLSCDYQPYSHSNYWQEVKHEIEKL